MRINPFLEGGLTYEPDPKPSPKPALGLQRSCESPPAAARSDQDRARAWLRPVPFQFAAARKCDWRPPLLHLWSRPEVGPTLLEPDARDTCLYSPSKNSPGRRRSEPAAVVYALPPRRASRSPGCYRRRTNGNARRTPGSTAPPSARVLRSNSLPGPVGGRDKSSPVDQHFRYETRRGSRRHLVQARSEHDRRREIPVPARREPCGQWSRA